MSRRFPLLPERTHISEFTSVRTTRVHCIIAVWVMILLLVSVPASSNAEETEVSSKITSVTVYPDRARIERTAKLRLAPGEHRVLFPGLPSSVETRSFRVRGRSSSPVIILGSGTKTVHHMEAVDERVRSLEEAIAELEKEKLLLGARLEVTRSQKEFVESVKSTTTELLSKELGLGRINAQGWREAFDFVGASLDDLAGRRLDLEDQIRSLDEKISRLMKELEQLRRAGAKQSFTVTTDLEIGEPGGEVELFLTYLIGGAHWVPSYDARLFPDENRVEMTAYGFVSQKTGEDWKDVDLSLSTAEPAEGAAPPELAGWYLDLEEPEVAHKPGGRAKAMEYEVDEMRQPTAAGATGHAALQAGVMQVAVLEQAGVTATYKVLSKEDVPADGNPAKTAIGQMNFSPELRHAATPLRVEKVYLSSDIVNDSEHTLLPGRVDVFVGSDMVGRSLLDRPVVTGEKFHLSFGTDPEVKVKREVIKRETSNASKDKRRRLESYKIMLHNYKTIPVVVTLKDRLPVSRNKEINIDVRKLEPEPDLVGPDGITQWMLTVPPGEEVSVLIEYRITYPADVWIRGL